MIGERTGWSGQAWTSKLYLDVHGSGQPSTALVLAFRIVFKSQISIACNNNQLARGRNLAMRRPLPNDKQIIETDISARQNWQLMFEFTRNTADSNSYKIRGNS